MGRAASPSDAGTIELRELRVFFTLADELHFGRSAQRLGVGPSRVSQTLRELERKLGEQLLHRTSRRVALTPFGEQFLSDAMPAYQQLAGILQHARMSIHGLEGLLRLGLLFPTAGGPHLTAITEAFEQRYPRCEVKLQEVLFHDPLGPLWRDEIDLLAMRLPIEGADVTVGPALSSEPRVLQVARHHPLASREPVSFEDISNYRLIPLNGFPPETMEAIIPQATTDRPVRQQLQLTPRTPFEVSALVARGFGTHLTVTSYAEYFRHPDIVHIPVRDLPPATTGLVWRRNASDPRIQRFAQVAQDIIAARSDHDSAEAPGLHTPPLEDCNK